MDSDSYSKQQLDDLFMDMIAYYDGDPKRIQHFTKVHSYARLIGIGEELMMPRSLYLRQRLTHTILAYVWRRRSMAGAMESFRSRRDR